MDEYKKGQKIIVWNLAEMNLLDEFELMDSSTSTMTFVKLPVKEQQMMSSVFVTMVIYSSSDSDSVTMVI